MKTQKNKIAAITISLLFILSIAASVTLIPNTNAHTPSWNIPTWAYLSVSPSTVGIGQYTQVVMWLNTIVPTSTGTGGDLFRGFIVNVTAPDGTITTLGPFTSDQVASQYTTFTPTQVGIYTMVFSWPGQILVNGTNPNPAGAPYVGDFFEGATSNTVTLTVTQTPLASWTEAPIPTDYWTLPINSANREWSSLASNYLKGGWLSTPEFQNEGTGPTSAHILWQEPEMPGYPGGTLDAQWPGITSDSNDYQTVFATPIVMNGILYMNDPTTENTPKYGYFAVSLYTGKLLWYQNATSGGLSNAIATMGSLAGAGGYGLPFAQIYPQLAFGQLLHVYNVNGQGIDSYLWMTQGNTWYMLDSSTGNWILTLTNVPSGTQVSDQDGNILIYSYNAATGNFLCWNSTQAIPFWNPGTNTGEQTWRPPVGATINAINYQPFLSYGLPLGSSANTGGGLWNISDEYHSSYSMNVTMPQLKGLNPGSITAVICDDNRVPQQILGYSFSGPGYSQSITAAGAQMYAWCVQINYGATGYNGNPYGASLDPQANTNLGYTLTLLWNKTIPAPLPGNITYATGGSNIAYSYDDQVFCLFAKETTQWFGYSLTNGNLLWGPSDPMGPWDVYGGSGTSTEGAPVIAYHTLMMGGYGGVLYGYNDKTGAVLWNYTAPNVGYESAYGNYPLDMGIVCDGKVYMYTSEHSPTKPLERGSEIRCINSTNGQLIWAVQDYVTQSGSTTLAIADGYMISGNLYDNMIYCYGKGPSATTVTTSPGNTVGAPVTIQGSVTDQSPGALGINSLSTQGTPAVSDASMQHWMEYLYMQQPKPTDTIGVPVSLDTIDPNGNLVHIGDVTSDTHGNYGYTFTPKIPGTYQIIATFAGTNSYGSSSATTYLGIAEASAPTATPTQLPTSVADTYFVPAIAGLFVLIIIVLIVVVLLMLRKRP